MESTAPGDFERAKRSPKIRSLKEGQPHTRKREKVGLAVKYERGDGSVTIIMWGQ